MPGWNPNSGRKYYAAKSVNMSLSPIDLEMVDERAKLLNVGRSGALRSLLQDARRAARTGTGGVPGRVYVPEAVRPLGTYPVAPDYTGIDRVGGDA